MPQPERLGLLSAFNRKGAPPLCAAAVFGRLSYGIVPMAILLGVAERYGVTAGGVSFAAFMAAASLAATVRMRFVIEAPGSRNAILLTAWLASITGLALALGHAPAWAVVLLTVMAGAVSPPVGPAVRSAWEHLAAGDVVLLTALNLGDSILEEATFVVSPLLTTLILVTIGPRWALLAGGVILIPAVVMFVKVRALRPRDHIPDTAKTAARHPARRLRQAPIAEVTLPIAFMALAVGGLSDVLPAVSAAHLGGFGLAGISFSVLSLGGVIMGLASNRFMAGFSAVRMYRFGMLALVLGFLALLPALRGWWLLLPLAVIGAAVTPMFSSAYTLVPLAIRTDLRDETNALLGSAYNIGAGVGAAACGLLIKHWGPSWVTVLLLGIAACGCAYGLRLNSVRSQLQAEPAAAQ
jgi:hypothetical protein